MPPPPTPPTWPRLPDMMGMNTFSRRRTELAAAGRRLVDLTQTDPTRGGLPSPDDAALRFLMDPRVLRHEPEAAGARHAREGVAAYYADHGALVDPDRIVLTASTSEGYAHLFRLLAAPGDTFLVPAPSYPLVAPLAALEGVKLRPYALHWAAGRWWLDRPGFEAALADGDVRGVIVVQPNNPTGSILTADEWEFVAGHAAAAGAVVLADEVFLDFPAPGRKPGTLAGASEVPLVVLSGLSKVAGLPQMKLGWMVVNGPEATATELTRGLEWIADAFLSVGAPIQAALPTFLAGRHLFLDATRARLDVNEGLLIQRTEGHPLTVRPREGGWSAVVQLPAVRSDEAWALRLLEAGVVVHPGHFYDSDEVSLIVLSLLTPENEWAEGLERLLAALGPM